MPAAIHRNGYGTGRGTLLDELAWNERCLGLGAELLSIAPNHPGDDDMPPPAQIEIGSASGSGRRARHQSPRRNVEHAHIVPAAMILHPRRQDDLQALLALLHSSAITEIR